MPSIPAQVVGWRLLLSLHDNAGEQRESAAWLQRHSEDGINPWMAQATQAYKRVAWDHEYRHAISWRRF